MTPFLLLADLAKALGAAPINRLPGCWERKLDDAWWFSVNAHREEMTDSHGGKVPPFGAVVEYNGWPAGILQAGGEGIFAAGSGANVETFQAALRIAIVAAGGTVTEMPDAD